MPLGKDWFVSVDEGSVPTGDLGGHDRPVGDVLKIHGDSVMELANPWRDELGVSPEKGYSLNGIAVDVDVLLDNFDIEESGKISPDKPAHAAEARRLPGTPPGS